MPHTSVEEKEEIDSKVELKGETDDQQEEKEEDHAIGS